MSPRNDLRSVIATDGLTPDSVRTLQAIADDGFTKWPSPASFFARSLFRALAVAWDDSQAVSTVHFDLVQQRLLPELRTWLRSDYSFDDPGELRHLAQAIRDCNL